MDMNIIISPGTSMDVLYGILNALSDNNADKKATEKVNGCIKALIDTLNKKGFDTSSRYSNLLKKLPNDKIQEGHIEVINKLIGELILFYETPKIKLTFDGKNTKKQKTKKNKSKISDWDAFKVDDELVLSYIKFINTITSSDCVASYPLNQKIELDNAIKSILKLLKMQDFQNQIFTGGDNQEKLISEYISTLLNISQAEVFEFMTKDNKNMFVQILDSLWNQKNLSEKVFCKDNVGDDGVIQCYINTLTNLASLITPNKTGYNDVAKANIRQQIDTNGVKFLITSLNKFVTDKTLIELVFNGKNNQKTIELFFDFLLNLACHTNYLENNGCFHDISDLLKVLQIMLGDPFKDLFVVPKFCHKFLCCYGEIFLHASTLNDAQKETLSDMLNTTLLGDEWAKVIVADENFSDDYFINLEVFLEHNKNLVDCKSVINILCNFLEDKRIRQMSNRKIYIKSYLFMLEDAIERYSIIDDKNPDLTFEKIVCILNNVQNKDYKFKEQIFYKNEIDEPINENAKDTSTKIMFDNEISKHKHSIARLYTGMLKNVAQLFNNKNINIQHKQAFFSLICDILIKKEHEDIRKMIFSENEIGKQGAIYNFNQAFSNLLSVDNLNNLYTNDKKMYVELLLKFICDENLNKQIYTLANNDQIKKDDIQQYKSAITRFYTGMLKNVAKLSGEVNIDDKYKLQFCKLGQNIITGTKISKMIFSGNENGPQGAICDLMQVFFYLLTANNLKALPKDDRNSLIQTFLLFVRENELQRQIFQSCNTGENGAIGFCLKTLVNLLLFDMEQFKDKDKTAIQNLLTNLKQNYSKANMNLNKYAEFNQIKNILDLNKKQNEKQVSEFKLIKYIFQTEKKLEKSNSSSELLLSSQISKSKNTPIRTNNNVQKLKISNSIGNFFQINKKTGNKQLNLNLNTFKPKVNTTQIKIGKAFSKQNTLPKLYNSSEIQNKIGKNEFE